MTNNRFYNDFESFNSHLLKIAGKSLQNNFLLFSNRKNALDIYGKRKIKVISMLLSKDYSNQGDLAIHKNY